MSANCAMLPSPRKGQGEGSARRLVPYDQTVFQLNFAPRGALYKWII